MAQRSGRCFPSSARSSFWPIASVIAAELCFNIPSLYLGRADEPGGGDDPNLLAIPSLLGAHSNAIAADALPSAEAIDHFLSSIGLTVRKWRFRQRITQEAYRDWLKIPILTNQWFEGLDADERALRIDRAFECVDSTSWRWEEWSGWTAARTGAVNVEYLECHQPLTRGLETSRAMDTSAGPFSPTPWPATIAFGREAIQARLHVPPGAAHDDLKFLELQREVAVLPEWESLRRDPAQQYENEPGT